MNEAETRAELIDPALRELGWVTEDNIKVSREFKINNGRILTGGRNADPKIADYLLTVNDQDLAVIEAKSDEKPLSEGVAQAKKYAQLLQTRFTYSTNGKEILQIDMETGKEEKIHNYPTPERLWDMVHGNITDWETKFNEVPFETYSGTKQMRYYQKNAVNNVLKAIANGEQRLLLTLATGTGKTFIAFQIAWKLFYARWNNRNVENQRPRVLFLADRNILADQAYNSFNAFAEDALVRIRPGKVSTSGSIFFTIFQTFMTGSGDENEDMKEFELKRYEEYPPEFFDLIIIDECHRGGAKDESNWRGIMEYFKPAVQLGLTATPRTKDNANTYKYFGKPVYQYSLKEGIQDGFLTPFKVKTIESSMDEYIYESDDDVEEGEIEEGKTYDLKDWNVTIEIEENKILPKKGVYFVEILIDGKDLRGMCNVGVRPTVSNKNGRISIEVHIFDFDNNLYGQPVCVALVAYLRPERKFKTSAALRAAMDQDALRARAILASPAAAPSGSRY